MVLSGVSLLWTRFSYFDCKRSRQRKHDKAPRSPSASLEIAVLSKTRTFEQPSGASPNYLQPGRHNGDAGLRDSGDSGFECRRTRHGKNWVSGVRSGGQKVPLGGSSDQAKVLPFPLQLSMMLRWVPWLKTQFWLTRSKSSRNLLLFQQLQPPRDHPNRKFMRSCPFGKRIENVPDYIYRKLFE